MWYHSVLDSLKSGSGRTGARRGRQVTPRKSPAKYKLNLELLEDRSLLSSSPLLNHAVGWDPQSAAVVDGNGAMSPTLPSPDLAGGQGVQMTARRDGHHAASWTAAASMADRRGFHSATLLDDGTVLVAGGFQQAPNHSLAGAELYDPKSDTWTPTGDLVGARAGHAAVKLADGRVLVAGVQTYNPPGSPPIVLRSAEIYDPDTGQWTATGSMNIARTEPVLTLLPDGRVFISGATRGTGPAQSAEIYDPDTGQWTRVADMSTSRNDHVQILLDDGRVLVAGGFRDTIPAPGAYFASAEIYDPDTNTWTPTGSMTMPRADSEGVLLEDGRVLVTGGNTVIAPATRTNTAEIYDPETGTWTRTAGVMSDVRVDHTITLLKHGLVLVTGGIRASDTPNTSADLYDPDTDTWTPTASMSRARGGHQAVLLKHNRVLVTGGLNFDPDTPPAHALASAEIFEPGKGRPHKGHSHSMEFPDAAPGIAVGIDPVGDGTGPSTGSDGTISGHLPSGAGFAANGFLGSIAATLTASAAQPTLPATLSAATPIPASAAPLVPVGETGADPLSPDVPAVAAAAASDALFTDPRDHLWYEGLGDDL